MFQKSHKKISLYHTAEHGHRQIQNYWVLWTLATHGIPPGAYQRIHQRSTIISEVDTEPLSFLWYRDGKFDNPFTQIYVDGSKSSIATYGMERTATNLSDHNPGAHTSGAPRQDYQEVMTGHWIGKNHPTSQYNLMNLVPNSG